jgi:uncharacterized protein
MPAMPIQFRTLSDDEARSLLASQHVGRLAYSYRQRVDIEPIHFVMDGEWIYLRTEQGTKLSMLEHQPWVAFEVDAVTNLFDWKSVVVHGTVELLDAEGGVEAAARWTHAVQVFRRLVPEAFQAGDPTPSRNVLLRVHLSNVEGRAASTSAASANA